MKPSNDSGSYEYAIGEVRFEGYKDGVLLEAKGFYQQLFKSGKVEKEQIYERMQDQLQRQVDAANGKKLEWHFAEQATMEQFQKYLTGSDTGEKLLEKVTLKVTKYEGK